MEIHTEGVDLSGKVWIYIAVAEPEFIPRPADMKPEPFHGKKTKVTTQDQTCCLCSPMF